MPLSSYLVELLDLVYDVQLWLFNFRIVSKMFIIFLPSMPIFTDIKNNIIE